VRPFDGFSDGRGKVCDGGGGYVLLGSLAHDSVANVYYKVKNMKSGPPFVLLSGRVGRWGEGRNEKLVRCPRRIPGPAGATENRVELKHITNRRDCLGRVRRL